MTSILLLRDFPHPVIFYNATTVRCAFNQFLFSGGRLNVLPLSVHYLPPESCPINSSVALSPPSHSHFDSVPIVEE